MRMGIETAFRGILFLTKGIWSSTGDSFGSSKKLFTKTCGLFTKNSQCSTRTLRNTGTDVRLPKKNSANGQKCFSFRGAKLWNSLSAESKQASSLNSFKKSI